MELKPISKTQALILVIFIYIGIIYKLDYYDWHGGKHGGTHRGIAQIETKHTYRIINYISMCNRFPNNFKELYDDKYSELNINCKAIRNLYPFLIHDNDPWNDPWGCPYQIRYDRERRKLQVRSQGRYLWTELDDIVGEASMAIPIDMADAEIAKCDSLPKDDMSCIFNRGWH